MKKFLKGFIALSLGLAMVGCAKEYDDTALKSKVDALDKKVSELDQKVNALSGQVTGLATTVKAWQDKGFVEEGYPKEIKNDDGDVIGWLVKFVGGKEVALYNGADGQDGAPGAPGAPGEPGASGAAGADGQTPTIILYEGNLVWAVGTEPILVDDKPVPASVIPTFAINTEGHLIMTLNGQETDLGKVKGEDGAGGGAGGDSILKSIAVSEDGENVIFTLTNDTVYEIPLAKAFKLVIEKPEQEVEAGATIKVPFTVQNGEAAMVDCFAGGLYTAKIVENDVVVNVPDPFTPGQVLVWAQNDKGLFSMVKLSFIAAANLVVVTSADEMEAIPAAAGDFAITLTSNVDVEVNIPQEATWVSAVVTKAEYTVTLTLEENETGAPREAEITVVRADNGAALKTIKIVQLFGELTIKTLFAKNSTASEAWNAYYGGTAGTDRNIAMDDDYIYIAESTAAAKLLAISIADPNQVKQVNVEGVTGGGAHVLSCPRVVKNTDASVNGGKDVLICSSLTRGGVDPKLYIWANGIDNAPKAITLTTWATDNWYGDTFTVWGTLQDGVLLFDKTDTGGNGVVTFILNGVPTSDQMYLVGRVKTVDAFGSHTGACALYLFPDGAAGIYSPGRGTEARGQIATLGSSVKSEGGIAVTLSPLDYDEGTNAFVLGYNFIEWKGKRYVIYGNFVSNKKGYVRVRQGALTDEWSKVASTGTRLYRRDLESGGLTSSNSAMDITARVINGELYIAAQMQNVGFGLYKLCYE